MKKVLPIKHKNSRRKDKVPLLSALAAPSINLSVLAGIIAQVSNWQPTSQTLLEISAITLSILLVIFIIVLIRSNKSLIQNKEKLEKQYSEIEEQYQTLVRIKEDVRAGKKFELAVKSASDQIIITDPNGIILYANPAVEAISGFEPMKVLGKKAGSSTLWGGRMDKDFYDTFWHTIKEEKKPYKGTFENKKRNGVIYYAQTTVSPVLDESGEVQFFVGIERDITREKEVDRMKDEFVSLVSHQMRTPLSSVGWYLEMLMDGSLGNLSEEQRDCIINMFESNQRMVGLINTLLDVSRIEGREIAMELKSVDIKNLVEDLLEETKIKTGKSGQHIELDVPENLPKVDLDPQLIRNVYLNLIMNALKYSPDNSPVEIEIYQEGDFIISKIRDYGYGIPKKEQGKVFSKFFRGSNIKKVDPIGTGLGLYLSKAIIRESGGDIWFESHGDGTTFGITLPIQGVKHKQEKVTTIA